MSELDKAKPEVHVQLGEKKRSLVFNHWARAVIQEDRGPKFLPSIDYKNLNFHNLIILTWASLIDSCPELDGCTPELRRAGQRTVSKWIEALEDHTPLVTAVFQAITNSVPEDKKGQEDTNVKKQESQSSEKLPG